MRRILIILVSAGLLILVGLSGKIPGTPDHPTPTAAPDCQVNTIATGGTPTPGTDAARFVERLKARCADMARMETNPPTLLPPTDPQGRVLARQSCLDLQKQGFLQGDDCTRIPADAVYYRH